jgi:signal transduction histidine kinase
MAWERFKEFFELGPARPLPRDPSNEVVFRERARAHFRGALRGGALLFLALAVLSALADRLLCPGPLGFGRPFDDIRLAFVILGVGILLAVRQPFLAERPIIVGLGTLFTALTILGVFLLRIAPGEPDARIPYLLTIGLFVPVVGFPWRFMLGIFGSVMQLSDRVRQQVSELRRLAAHLERAREEERTHIARELHDELGQELTAMRYTLGLLRKRHERDPSSIGQNLDDFEALLARTTTTARHIVSELRPRILDDLGLVAAVEWLVDKTRERTGLTCELTTSAPTLDVSPNVSVAAFRIVQESLTNVARHARADRVGVGLSVEDQMLQIVVRDNGVGLSPSRRTAGERGMGLLGMTERAEGLGGELTIESSPEAGTTVRVRIPARREEAPGEVA